MIGRGPALPSRSAAYRQTGTQAKIDPISWLEELLEVGGIDSGLAFLNTRVEHRCSCIYRLAGDTLFMVNFYDCGGGMPLEILRTVPLDSSFCQFAMNNGSFVTQESMSDDRLQGNMFRPLIASYVGFPLIGANGNFIGSLCHFDIVERSISGAEFEFQRQAAPLFSPFLL